MHGTYRGRARCLVLNGRDRTNATLPGGPVPLPGRSTRDTGNGVSDGERINL